MKLHIIDCSLLDKKGHHYEYAKAVYDEWVRRGLPVSVHCHKTAQADILRYFKANGIFSRTMHHRTFPVPILGKLNLLINFLVTNYVFHGELKDGIPPASNPNEIYFFHTIDINQLFGMYAWYRAIRPENRPRLALIFRLGAGDNPGTRRYSILLYKIFFLAVSSIAGGKIFYFSDSIDLAEEYGKIAKKRVSVVPIPHLPDPKEAGNKNVHEIFQIVYLGDARIEKGYRLLPKVIENILAKRDNVKFIIQSNVSKDPTEEIVKAIEAIKALQGNVECIVEPLDSKDYYRMLLFADVVLLPYSPVLYRARTSGIFAEAIAFGIPVIVPEGTWMERQITEYGQCGIVMSGYSEESLEKSIDVFLDNSGVYRRRAEAASERWKIFHNIVTYADTLIDSISPENGKTG
jgi:glycosyltransferase involved in cell wall biosynthesis